MASSPQEQEPWWLLVDRDVDIHSELAPIPDASTWEVVRCRSKTACGCGPNGDSVVGGLTLFARVRPPPEISALRVQVSDAVAIAATSGLDGMFHTSDKDLAVIYLTIGVERYLLVCDAAASSLTVVPNIVTTRTGPVPAKHADGQALVTLYLRDRDAAAVYLWPLSPAPAPAPSSHWQRRAAIMPQFPPTLPGMCCFQAHLEFSSRDIGICFWVDLLQGVLYCKHNDLLPLSGDGDGDVQFHYIGLPPGTEADFDAPPTLTGYNLPELFRTMTVAGGTIMFAAIGVGRWFAQSSDPADRRTVTLWKLMPDLRHWDKDAEIKIGDVDGDGDIQIGHLLGDDAAGVEEWEVSHLVLATECPGVANMALSVYYHNIECKARHIMLCIDMRKRSLLSWCPLPAYFHISRPRLTSSAFFGLKSKLMDAEQE